jgi:hypothetical protein
MLTLRRPQCQVFGPGREEEVHYSLHPAGKSAQVIVIFGQFDKGLNALQSS